MNKTIALVLFVTLTASAQRRTRENDPMYEREIKIYTPKPANNPGTLLRKGGQNIALGFFVAIVGTVVSTAIAKNNSKNALYVSGGAGLVSLGLVIDGAAKISKAGTIIENQTKQ